MARSLPLVASIALLFGVAVACGSSDSSPGDGTGPSDDGGPASDAHPTDDVTVVDAGADTAEASAPVTDTSVANRDRLLATYLAYLKAHPGTQTNGLDGASLGTVCDLWTALTPSAKDTFLTLTARMQGSKLGADGSSMLSHVTTLYRAVGGDGATASDPGSCGGGENNRLIMSMDAKLHDAQVAANTNKGAIQASGKPDIADIGTDVWRESQDLGGAHAPFDLSDETNAGGPRGQTQYFDDPSSALAKTALGRTDLTTLIDPYALEMDQDYDCAHNSNPSCDYGFYGPLCAPEPNMTGDAIYTAKYGSYDPGYKPTGCP